MRPRSGPTNHDPGTKMSHRRSRLLTTLGSSLALTFAALGSSFADVVTLTSDATTKGASGGIVRGTVTAESPSKVEVKLGNSVTTIPTNEVVSIVYDGHPGLTRILMPDDWDGHPQRKDYPLGGIPVQYKGATIPPPDERRVYK